jgi:hypothetical protein
LSNPQKLKGLKLITYVYHGLISGKTQRQIIDLTGKDKGYISRITQGLESNGFIVCINPKSRDRFYKATKKKFHAKVSGEILKPSSRVSQRLHRGCKILDSHSHSFCINIKIPPKKEVKWDKTWELKNGVSHSVYRYPFKQLNGEVVTFQRVVSKDTDKLFVKLPKLLFPADVDPDEYVREVVSYAAGWFQKRYAVKLDGAIRKNVETEYGFFPDDPTLVRIAQGGGACSDDGSLWVDSSPPDNLAEIESHDRNLLNGISKAPMDIAQIRVEMEELRGFVREQSEMLRSLMESQRELMGMVRELFSVPVSVDERRDVV